MKLAILQVADTGPLESLVLMLHSAGYECHLPNAELRAELQPLGGLVLSPEQLQSSMGYDPPMDLPRCGSEAAKRCDLYVDVKAHQTYDKLVRKWPRLEKRVLWYRINGGKPEHVYGRGDEVDPPCPILTPNQWYKEHANAYTCWPPFARFEDYSREWPTRGYLPPVCLVHNVNGWGYRDVVSHMQSLGVRILGRGSPDGLVRHKDVPAILSSAVAMVHLKSSDAPGYAIYEAMAAGCPVVCTRRLIWRCRMQELLEPDATCLVFDRETHDPLTAYDVAKCMHEVSQHLRWLRDPENNRRIGEAGRRRLKELTWKDEAGFATWMRRTFP